MSTLVTIGEAARQLGVSVKTLRRWEEQKLLKPIRTMGGQRRYYLESVRELLESAEEPDDDDAENVEAVSGETERTQARQESAVAVPPWKARELEARADLSVVRSKIEQREEVRRYREQQARRAEAERIESQAREQQATLAAQQESTRQREQTALRLEINVIRMQLARETPAVRAEVEEFLAKNAILGASIHWIDAAVQAIVARHRAEYQAAEERRKADARRKMEDALKKLREQTENRQRADRLVADGLKYADQELAEEDIDVLTRMSVRDRVKTELEERIKPDSSPGRVESLVNRLLDELLADEVDEDE